MANSSTLPIKENREKSVISIFGIPIQTLDDIGRILMIAGFFLGAAALIASSISAYILYRVSNEVQRDASQRIAEWTSKTEEAKAEAARANESAAQANLALEKFKAPRSITPAQLMVIGNAATAHNGTAIDIFLAGDASDMPGLAQILSAELQRSANWKPMIWTWSGIPPFKGSFILIKDHASANNTAAARALSEALIGTDIASPVQVWPGTWETFSGMLNGTPFSAARSEIRLVIGGKPN